MNNQLESLKKDLIGVITPGKDKALMRFFKTGKGDYGEGDIFIGVMVPDQRKVAKKYEDLSFGDIKKLLDSDIHEHRFTALVILVNRFKKADEQGKKEVYDFYTKNRSRVNNWDLVDTSAHKIMGVYLLNRKRDVLYKLAKSKNLWDRRIAILTTFMFIHHNDFKDSLKIAEMLVNDEHDLIHKAVGWMIREIGKREPELQRRFLRKYQKTMPRVMYRYAVENGVRA